MYVYVCKSILFHLEKDGPSVRNRLSQSAISNRRRSHVPVERCIEDEDDESLVNDQGYLNTYRCVSNLSEC